MRGMFRTLDIKAVSGHCDFFVRNKRVKFIFRESNFLISLVPSLPRLPSLFSLFLLASFYAILPSRFFELFTFKWNVDRKKNEKNENSKTMVPINWQAFLGDFLPFTENEAEVGRSRLYEKCVQPIIKAQRNWVKECKSWRNDWKTAKSYSRKLWRLIICEGWNHNKSVCDVECRNEF